MRMPNPLSWLIHRLAQKVAFEILPVGVVDGQPIYPKQTYPNYVNQGYKKNEVIFACMKRLQNSLAQVDLDVVNAKGDPLQDHSLKKLLEKPSPFTSQFDFLTMIVIDLALDGNAYFEKVRSASGQVVQLWRLRPDFVRPVPTKDKFISFYEYDNNTGHKVRLPEEDVIRFYQFDPLNAYLGMATIQPATRVGDVDNATVDYIKKLFDSGGIPSGFLKFERAIDDEKAKQYSEKWSNRYGGHDNWHKPAVLGMGADYQQLGMDFDKMAMKDIDVKTITRICMVFGVNPLLLGILIKSTFDNMATAQQEFWEQTLLPQMKSILFTLNNQLVLGEFPGVKLKWDLAGVKALQVDQDKLYTRANGAIMTGALTVNEYRQMIDKPEVRGGDVFLRGAQVVEVGTTATKSAQNVFSHEAILSKKQNDELKLLLDKLDKETKADLENPPDADERLVQENKLAVTVQKFFKGQQRRILATVEKKDSPLVLALKDAGIDTRFMPESKFYTWNYEQPFEDGRDDLILNAYKQAGENEFWQNEDDLFNLAMYPALLESAQISVENTIAAFMEQYTIGIDIDLANTATADWAKKYSAQLVKGINKTTRKSTTKAIVDWVNNDQPRSALIDEIAPLFGETRSKMIARTENTNAFFEGNRQTWKVSGIAKKFKWRTSRDEAVCPICGPLEGQTFDINSSTHPAAHPNCRCWAVAVVEV